MRQILLYICLFILITGCDKQKGAGISIPSLNETYDRTDKKPFGGFVAYNHTKLLLGDPYIETITDPFPETWNKMIKYDNSEPSLYLLITKNLILSANEAESMVSYVKEGNDLFISADYFDEIFLDKIDMRVDRDSEFVKEMLGIMTDATVKAADIMDPAFYKYYYYPFLNSFSGYDDEFTKVLGYNQAGKPNYVVKFMDKGRIYLHAAPRAFGNYFLLKNENHKYLEKVLSYIPAALDNIYWDAYYQKKTYRRRSTSDSGGGDENAFSSFDVIMRNPALRGAFWLGLIALLLYVLFNIKRKQRTIREIPPLVNTSVVFTETVGRLYLQKKNNKNIAEKMITYFYEYVRNKYFLNTGRINDELMVSLSGKSGMEVNETRELFSMINNVHEKRDISDVELLALNQKIQNFYKLKS